MAATQTSIKKNLTSKMTKATIAKTKSSDSKSGSVRDRQSRIEIFQWISDRTGLKRVDVEAVFTEFQALTEAHLRKKGSGEIIVPKLGLKIRRVRRKPTKKRKMISPLTGSEVIIPAKPARDDVKLTALKSLKSLVD